MLNVSTYDCIDFRTLIPEVIHLETEHFEQAKKICLQTSDETKQWESYLNSLALVAFKDWLAEKLFQYNVDLNTEIIDHNYCLFAGKFKYCLIAIEHVLDEVVSISRKAIDIATMLADFYVLIEVLEEEEEVIIKGFLNYQDLTNYCFQFNSQLFQDDYYQIPLLAFDSEPNHLILYHQFADVAELSAAANPGTISIQKTLIDGLEEKVPKLSKWLNNVFDEGWLTIERLTKVERNLAFNTRKIPEGVRRCKLIDLEIQLGTYSVALLVNIIEVNDKKFSILIQLHPAGQNKYLPHNLQLRMFSKAGKMLQEVQSRVQDNYIQLKSFKGEAGKRFSIEVSLNNVSFKEHFEI